jgi:MFS family permease
MDTFGAVIGTILASALLFALGKYTNFSLISQYRTIFWLSVIPGILGILTVAFMVHDVKAKGFVKNEIPLSWATFGSGFKAFLLVSVIFELSNFSYAIFILRAYNLGVIAALIPIIYLLYNIIYSFLAHPLGVLADKIGKKTVLFFGYLLASIMCLGFAYATNPVYAWVLFAVYGLVSAITNTTPRAILADIVKVEFRGTAYGIYYMLIGIIALPTSAIAGLLWDLYGAFTAFSYGAIFAFIAAMLVLALIPNKVSKLSSQSN